VLIKKRPPGDRKLLIIGTTSMKRTMQDLAVVESFNTCQNVPLVSMQEEIVTILSNFPITGGSSAIIKIAKDFIDFIPQDELQQSGIPIKTILLAIELAIERGGNGQLQHGIFMDCLRSIHK
jgi:vesicle-fusing ATPase